MTDLFLSARKGPPAASSLEHGDLLWPKREGSIIPYFMGDEAGVSLEDERTLWEQEHWRYCEGGRPDDVSETQYRLICDLTYDRFREFYGEESASGPKDARGGRISVGHVAIVDGQKATPSIIEALLKPGVISRSYSEWEADHETDLVWHGRFGAPISSDPEAYVAHARAQVGKPYNFWGFNLADDSGFYCSKLVWYGVFKAHGFGVDGNDSPKRGIWYSPKQLTRSPFLAMLVPDGPYQIA